METQPADPPMWPVHSAAWLQLELRPALPETSGLRIERQCKVPVPDFLHFDLRPAGGSHVPERVSHPLPPEVPEQRPRSDLAPLGWDPRVASHVVLTVPVNGRGPDGVSLSIPLNGKSHPKGSDE